MLNKTNTFQTNESTENFAAEIFSDKQTNEHPKPKSIRFIEDHSIEIFKDTINVEQNLKKESPNITHALETIRNYINQILTETERIEQILTNTTDTTNAPKSNATNAVKNFEQYAGADSPTSNNCEQN